MFHLHFHSHKWSRQGLERVEQIHPICTEEREMEGVSEMGERAKMGRVQRREGSSEGEKQNEDETSTYIITMYEPRFINLWMKLTIHAVNRYA